MSDRRKVDGNRAMKRGFTGGHVKPSLWRDIRQQLPPWPAINEKKPQAPVQAVGATIPKQEPT